MLAGVERDCQGEAVVCSGSQQSACGPRGGAQQGFGAREGLQKYAVSQMRQRSWARPLCAKSSTPQHLWKSLVHDSAIHTLQTC